MAADRALDAVGVRGASGGRGYCWPPAAPPHQQVPTWGQRPIHEVGAVGRSGGEAGGAYRSLHAREGGGHHVPLSPAFIPEFLLVRWLARRGCISSGALYLARSTRTGIASPHHTFPPETGLQSLSEWQIPTVVLWEGVQKLYSHNSVITNHFGIHLFRQKVRYNGVRYKRWIGIFLFLTAVNERFLLF